jgi:hypothetical protein
MKSSPDAKGRIEAALWFWGTRVGMMNLGRVLMNAQIESPLSGVNRQTFARCELYWF